MSTRPAILGMLAGVGLAATAAMAQSDTSSDRWYGQDDQQQPRRYTQPRQDDTWQNRTQDGQSWQGQFRQDQFQQDQFQPDQFGRDRFQQDQLGQDQWMQNQPRQGTGDEGQVVIGYDLDRDGQTDAWYYVSRQDYNRMLRENQHALSSNRGQSRLFGQQDPWNQQTQRFDRQQTWDQQDWQRQQQMRYGQPQDPWAQQGGDQFGLAGQPAQQHRGEVTEVSTHRLTEDGKRHVFARVDLENGRRAVVHLGPEENLRNIDLEEGQRITFTGRQGQINNRPVIHAERVQAGGQTAYIQSTGVGRSQMYGQEQDFGRTQEFGRSQNFGAQGFDDQDFGRAGFGQPQNLRQVRGEIQDVRTLRPDGADQPHTIARVELDSGSTVVVDLGPQEDLRDLELTRGDQIQALVRPAMVNNRQILKAHELRANNETIRVRDPMTGRQNMNDPYRQQMQDRRWRDGDY